MDRFRERVHLDSGETMPLQRIEITSSSGKEILFSCLQCICLSISVYSIDFSLDHIVDR